ncbi:MAG: YggS family pyridoxal phosphate-dependent enzyme [Verrucomicrobia bacterium]|nr:YggS family pyridoxal phosphate-dependent enzyme [Verrucomicrobiota bacterium]
MARNLDAIRGRIADAAERAGRSPDDVTLVCVTKTRSLDEIRAALDWGVPVLGESRVQEAAEKIPQLPHTVTWHLIGHLQRNKVKHALELFDMIHSVDSLRLAEEIESRAAAAQEIVPVLIEVNVAGEDSKFGAALDEVEQLAETIGRMPNVDLAGLMTMAPFVDDPETVRHIFSGLRELRDRIRDEHGLDLPHLSMGMTQDYEVAVEEGATMVRIGSAVFEQ